MHELQLMRQVVQQVEEVCRGIPGAQPTVITLQVNHHSHMAGHQPDELQATFQLAAKGTVAEHARLSVHLAPLMGQCLTCGVTVESSYEAKSCPHCQTEDVLWEQGPEILIQDVECTVKEDGTSNPSEISTS